MDKSDTKFFDDEAVFKQPGDCCKTEDGRKDPEIDIDVTVADNNETLRLSCRVTHACGIVACSVSVSYFDSKGKPWTYYGGVLTRLLDMTNGRFNLNFGPDEDSQLPAPIDANLKITVNATSECGTQRTERFRLMPF